MNDSNATLGSTRPFAEQLPTYQLQIFYSYRASCFITQVTYPAKELSRRPDLKVGFALFQKCKVLLLQPLISVWQAAVSFAEWQLVLLSCFFQLEKKQNKNMSGVLSKTIQTPA